MIDEEFVNEINSNVQMQVDGVKSDVATQLGSVNKRVSNNQKEIAYLNLKQEAADRIENGTTFADDMQGTSFGMRLKNVRTKSTETLTAGETILAQGDELRRIGAIENGSFTVGDKVTVLDDLNSESVEITRSEVVTDIATHTVNDATVVNQAYDTSGNGGRKLVMLDNGTLVCSVINSNDGVLKLYKATDSGNTWTEIVNVAESVTNVSICNNGNIIHVINSTSAGFLKARSFDSNGTLLYGVNLDSGQTAFNSASITINHDGTELHAAWSSKNSTYPNSFNIRYAKGVINTDGSVTWGVVSYVRSTPLNTTNMDDLNPSIVIAGSIPIATFETKNIVSNQYVIHSAKQLTSGWQLTSIYLSNGYSQSSPSAIYVPPEISGTPNGRIWVAWHGKDSTDASFYNIRVSYSDDLGVTWSTIQKITSGNNQQSDVTITANNSNEIFLIWLGINDDGTAWVIRSRKNSGGVWGTVSNVVTTGNSSSVPTSLFDDSFGVNFIEPLFIYKDVVKGRIGFYGSWETGKDSHYLETSPLQNDYKKGAWIAESTMNTDGTFPEWDGNYEGSLAPRTSATATYELPSTDYIGAFVQTAGNVDNLDAYINDVKITGELDDVEYMFEHFLLTEGPVKLRLEATRQDTTGGANDKISRILGGIS